MLETKNKLKLAFLTCILDIAIINTYVSGTSKINHQSKLQIQICLFMIKYSAY